MCIDEFQNINHFPHPVDFQRKLRAYWQQHNKVHYCLYGSKRHLMSQLFESWDLPFYRFGAVLYLKTISIDEWIPFVSNKFRKTGKSISATDIRTICMAMDNHSYYTQYAFQILWYISSNKVTATDVEHTLMRLAEQNELQFQKVIESLKLNFEIASRTLSFDRLIFPFLNVHDRLKDTIAERLRLEYFASQ